MRTKCMQIAKRCSDKHKDTKYTQHESPKLIMKTSVSARAFVSWRAAGYGFGSGLYLYAYAVTNIYHGKTGLRIHERNPHPLCAPQAKPHNPHNHSETRQLDVDIEQMCTHQNIGSNNLSAVFASNLISYRRRIANAASANTYRTLITRGSRSGNINATFNYGTVIASSNCSVVALEIFSRFR